MRLYSDSLFHYTECIDTLLLIVKQGFKISSPQEQFIGSKDNFLYLRIPLVSFCDIPISLIQYVSYGNIGIGMSRAWATKNLIQPVQYFSNSKKTSSNLSERYLADCYMNGDCSTRITRQLSTLKPIRKYKDGDYGSHRITTNSGDIIKVYYRRDNYIEREWRKVYLNHWDDDYYTKNPTYLQFTNKNVSFLIVNTLDEKEKLINSILNLNTIGGKTCSNNDRLSLATKILVMKEIKKNF